MTTSFRSSYQVLRRNLGTWNEGVYTPDDDNGTLITVMATVQQPSTGDMARIEVSPWGKRAGRFIKIYTDTRLHCVNQEIGGTRQQYPGDIFYFDGSEYLLFGESNFQMLQVTRSTQVSHWRYYACELIESFNGEMLH